MGNVGGVDAEYAFRGSAPYLVACTVAHVAFSFIFKSRGWEKYAAAGHEIASLLVMVALVTLGVVGLFNMPDDPIYGSTPVTNTLCLLMLGYALYATVAALVIEEMREIPFIGHHVGVTVLAYLGAAPFLHGYSMFFFGIAEFSTVVVCVMQLFKLEPTLQEEHPGMYQAVRAMFAILFILLRLIVWPLLSLKFWMDMYDLLEAGEERSLFAVVCFMVCNVGLTGLQFFWGRQVIKGLLKSIRKSKLIADKDTVLAEGYGTTQVPEPEVTADEASPMNRSFA
eukprot:TRINITY_DN50768_c0_g1_i1.p1 TRINITY_DN50768_c0_g1~~TRINITY_DN50768_c0_g1_i1.p1  ORF type:complete len:282 (+),score=88.78 TRINITY_DN50768_c0_g1_i1:81-926(+)